ncbi:YbhB/YbcL family Raf kinase inhibitor-like protein [Sulfurimicrobium lacus]
MMKFSLQAAVALMLLCAAAVGFASSGGKEDRTMGFTLTSSAFSHNGAIPSLHTCDSRDVSPPLSWTPPPAGTKSLVLIVDDPDAPDPAAPRMTWVHWVLYNIPPGTTGLAGGMTAQDLPHGTLQGTNDWQRSAYGGPCPPVGRHRYFHKLYALDTLLPNLKIPTKATLERAMKGHVLAQAELVGLYQKH